jgi:hypothetical protein
MKKTTARRSFMSVPNKKTAQLTAEDVAAILEEAAQKATDLDSALALLDELVPKDFFEGEGEELDFAPDLLVTLYSTMEDAKLDAKARAEKINDYLMKNSAYGFLGYEFSRKSYQMRPFTYGDVDEALDMSIPENKRYREHFDTQDEYLKECKRIHDETERERKEIEDRVVEKAVREQLASSEAYREEFYRYIAIPKEFGARGDYRLGVFELVSLRDYDYLYGFDHTALKARGDDFSCELASKKSDDGENTDLTDFAKDYVHLKKSAATDKAIEAALSLVPFLYERCPALEGLHQDPNRAHGAYLAALRKRQPTEARGKRVTANPFEDIKALRERSALSVEETYQREKSAARKKAVNTALRAKMTMAFWCLLVLDVIGLIGAFAYTYQTTTTLPAAVYLIGAVIAAAAFVICARFVDCDWSWSEHDWKIGILIAIGVLTVIWLAMAAAPEALLESLPANR